MKIYYILVVKNEIDVIQSHIENIAPQVDTVNVMDNGSTDGTREWLEGNDLVTRLFDGSEKTFNNSLRGEVFRMIESNEDDWVLFLGADHFLEEDLRAFIGNAVDAKCNAFNADHITFYYTDVDYNNRDSEDHSLDIRERRLYYETDFNFMVASRASKHLKWAVSASDNWTIPSLRAYDKHLAVSHYPFRTPDQIQKRLDDRR